MNDIERDALLQKIDATMDDLRLGQQRVRDALFDTNGNDGLCTKVGKICDKVDKHGTSITRLWVAITVIVGGGGGTVGIIELVKRLSNG